MSKEELIKSLVETRAKINQSNDEKSSLNKEIKECKLRENKIIKLLSEQ